MQTKSSPSGVRLAWIDDIRWTMIAMVVLMHACVTYSGIGSWYYNETLPLDIASTIVFSLYQTFAQAFFMGLLFFLAGTLVPKSYDRKGFIRFIGDRTARLGLPSLVFMLLLDPLSNIIRDVGTGTAFSWAAFLPWYRGFVLSGDFIGASGPLWFAVALLVFSIVYALMRLVGDLFSGGTARQAAPGTLAIADRTVTVAVIALTALIALFAFLLRLVQPIGTSILNMQLGYFSSYVVLFGAGLWFGRRGLLAVIPAKSGRTWLRLSVGIGLPTWLAVLGFGGALDGKGDLFMGGPHWQAFGYALWESYFCVAFSLGLIVLYREKARTPNRLSRLLSFTAFGAYTFHAPILVGVSILIIPLALHPLAKALVAAAAAWSLSVALAWAVRKVPGVGRFFA